MTYEELRALRIKAVRDYALAHYQDGGWDVIVEAWSDQDILDATPRVRTAAGAVAKVAEIVSVYADREADAVISAGGVWPDDGHNHERIYG